LRSVITHIGECNPDAANLFSRYVRDELTKIRYRKSQVRILSRGIYAIAFRPAAHTANCPRQGNLGSSTLVRHTQSFRWTECWLGYL